MAAVIFDGDSEFGRRQIQQFFSSGRLYGVVRLHFGEAFTGYDESGFAFHRGVGTFPRKAQRPFAFDASFERKTIPYERVDF